MTGDKVKMDEGVSIIVVSKSRTDNIERLLDTFMQKNTYQPVEFIIVDQNPEKDASIVMSKYAKSVFIRVIRQGNHSSFAESNNFASRKARFPYLLFIDDDIIYTADVLPIAVEKLSNPDIGVVGIRLDDDPEIIPAGQEVRVQHTGITFEWDDDKAFHRPILISHNSIAEVKEIKNGFYPAVTGAFMLCRKTDFEAGQGFCVEYDCEFEDVDLCLLLREDLNKKCYCINELSLQIRGGANFEGDDTESKTLRDAVNIRIFQRRMGEQVDSMMRDVGGNLPPLPSLKFTQPGPAKEKLSLNILFVLPAPPESSSGYQVQQLARILCANDADCIIAVPNESNEETKLTKDDKATQNKSGVPEMFFSSIREKGLTFPNGRAPDIIHAWTPREIVRKFVESIHTKYPCPIIIHMQENEEYLTEATVKKPFSELERLSSEELDTMIPEEYYHPVLGHKWLEKVQGLTVGAEMTPHVNHGDVPSLVLLPPADERLFYPRPLNFDFRKRLEIPEDHLVIAFTGNVHAGNRDEVRELYRAVRILNEQGCPAILLRTGKNVVKLGKEAWLTAFEKNLGWVDRYQVPDVMASADVLVQPGSANQNNGQHIPYKLTEYLSMGRPVILPRTNLGLNMEHGLEGYVLDNADGENIARAVLEISRDKDLAGRLAAGGVSFSRIRFERSAVNRLDRYYIRFKNDDDRAGNDP